MRDDIALRPTGRSSNSGSVRGGHRFSNTDQLLAKRGAECDAERDAERVNRYVFYPKGIDNFQRYENGVRFPMSKSKRKTMCAYTLDTPSTKSCESCAMPMSDNIELFRGKYCPVCKNRSKNETIMFMVRRMLYGVIFVIALLIFLDSVELMHGIFVIMLLIMFPGLVEGLMRRTMYRGLPQLQRVGSSLHMFAIVMDPGHLDVTLGVLKKLTDEEKDFIKEKAWPMFAMAMALAFSALPDNWTSRLAASLDIEEKDVHQHLIDDAGDLIVNAAVNNINRGMIDFVIALFRSTGDSEFMLKVLKTIENLQFDEMVSPKEVEILQEELFVNEDDLNEIAAELNHQNFAKSLEEKLEGYEAPPVPRTFLEAAMPPDQLRARQQQQSNSGPRIQRVGTGRNVARKRE